MSEKKSEVSAQIRRRFVFPNVTPLRLTPHADAAIRRDAVESKNHAVRGRVRVETDNTLYRAEPL